jgi:hypothetical protein
MIKPIAVLLPVAAMGVFAWMAWPSSANAKPKSNKPKSNCPPLPALDDETLADALEKGVEAGVTGLLPMTSFVARLLYPKRDDGTTIPWPTQPPFVLPQGFDGALVCRWEEIRGRLSNMPVPEPEEPTPADVLSDLLSDYPLPGKLYLIKTGDNLSTITRKALNNLSSGAGDVGSARMAYLLDCINMSSWNRDKYGSTRANTNFPKAYFTNGLGLAAAFLPRNADAIAAILAGKNPPRTIKPNGDAAGGGSKFGLLWLPPVVKTDLEKFGKPTCAGTQWQDGSSTIDPPPDLLHLLAA